MDVISSLIAAFLAVIALDLVAVRFGSDSRESLTDDHQR